VPTVEPAVGPFLDQILDANYDIWNEGLSRTAYHRWWAAQLATPWAQAGCAGTTRLRRTALVDGGEVLASSKEYLFDATLDGRQVTVLGIGAVFTQPAHRGRGHAAALIRQLLARAAANGVDLALLFSEIGPSYYQRLGFSVLPASDLELRVIRPMDRGAPATLVRAGAEQDLAAIAAINGRLSAPHRFHLNRDRNLIAYAIAKKRLLAGLGRAGRRELQFFVAEEGGSAVAYVVMTADPAWTIEECGDRDPSGARAGAMLQVLLAREPAAPPPRIRGWLPDGFLPPQVSVVARAPSAEVMMVRPLTPTADRALSLGSSDIFYWRADIF